MIEIVKLVETHGLAVVIAAMSVYTIFKSINIYLDKKIKSPKEQHDELLEIRKKIGEDIDTLLQNALIRANACRAFIFEYHNGVTSVGGLPFLKMTNTYEVVAPGVIPQQANLADLSCQLYHKFVRTVDKNPYVIFDVNDRKPEYGDLSYATLVEQGVQQSIIVKFVDLKNRSVGFVGFDYTCDNDACQRNSVDVAKELASKVGALLSI